MAKDFADGDGGEKQKVPIDEKSIRPPNVTEVQAEMRRLLTDEKFARNANTSRFLDYVVDETLSGRGARLKAFSIATQALRRPENFDPQTDSIVRVQAARVRSQLEEYYAGAGAASPIRISLPKGAYQPIFEWAPESEPEPASTNGGQPADAPTAEVLPPKALPTSYSSKVSPKLKIGAAALAACAVIAGMLVFVGGGAILPANRPMRFPIIAVSHTGALSDGGEKFAAADALLSRIEEDLALNEDVRLLRTNYDDAKPDYRLNVHFSESENGLFEVFFELTRAQSGEIVWSRRFYDVRASDGAKLDSVAQIVVDDIADVQGAVAVDVLRRFKEADAPLVGLYCRLTALKYISQRDPSKLRTALGCLEIQVAVEPDDISSLRLLSNLLLIIYLDYPEDSRGAVDVKRALGLARRAFDLDPQQINSLAAFFFARFADKRYAEATATADQILERNSSDALIKLRLGRVFVSRAQYAEGVPLLEAVESQLGAPQPTATAFLALAALMRDDPAALDRYTGRDSAGATPIGLLLGMIDCHMHSNRECVAERKKKLATQFPGFYADLPASFERYGLEKSIRHRLATETAALGLGNSDDHNSDASR